MHACMYMYIYIYTYTYINHICYSSFQFINLDSLALEVPRTMTPGRPCQDRSKWVLMGKIRPHRFGGEGVLIGGQSATLNAQ